MVVEAAGRVGELELPVYLWEEWGRPGGQACGRSENCHWAPVGLGRKILIL